MRGVVFRGDLSLTVTAGEVRITNSRLDLGGGTCFVADRLENVQLGVFSMVTSVLEQDPPDFLHEAEVEKSSQLLRCNLRPGNSLMLLFQIPILSYLLLPGDPRCFSSKRIEMIEQPNCKAISISHAPAPGLWKSSLSPTQRWMRVLLKATWSRTAEKTMKKHTHTQRPVVSAFGVVDLQAIAILERGQKASWPKVAMRTAKTGAAFDVRSTVTSPLNEQKGRNPFK